MHITSLHRGCNFPEAGVKTSREVVNIGQCERLDLVDNYWLVGNNFFYRYLFLLLFSSFGSILDKEEVSQIIFHCE